MSVQEHDAARSFYDRISHVYDLISDSGEHRAREKGLELLDAKRGEQVLELGYGTGHSLLKLAEAVGENGRVAGVDLSQGMFEIATRRVNEAGYQQRVDLKVAVVPPIPYEDQAFDAVAMSFVLELFPVEQIPDVLAEVSRVLRPGGRISVVSMATTKDGEQDSVLEHTYKWLHRHFPHIVDCQPIDVAGLIRRARFENVQETRMEIWTLPVAIVVATR